MACSGFGSQHELREEIRIEFAAHFVFHNLQSLERGFRIFVRSNRGEGVEYIGNQAYLAIGVNLVAMQTAGIPFPIMPLVVLHDNTEKKRIEQMKTDLVSNMSHELKTPLTSIRAYVETLLDGGLDDKENNLRFLKKIEVHASRLVALGRLELEIDPTLTLAYVRKSLEVHDSSEARRLALEALWRGPVARVLPVPKESEACIFVAPSPDGQWLLFDYSIPGLAPGEVGLVKADGSGGADEYPYEDNNLLVVPIFVEPYPLSDLVASDVVAPIQAIEGSQFEVRYSVANRGSGTTASDTWTDTIWLTHDKTRPSAYGNRAMLIGTVQHTGALGVGQSYEVITQVTLPSNLTPGTYYITPWSDSYDVIPEDTLASNLNPDDPHEMDNNNYKARAMAMIGIPPPWLTRSGRCCRCPPRRRPR